ncbi:MAG: dipeptide epimerase [bacterium]
MLAETFTIARGARDRASVVHVEVHHAGVVGYGEGSPNPRYGETAESALSFIQEHADLVGDDPWAHADVMQRLAEAPGEEAAKAAIDAALFDLRGKLISLPVYRLLGLPRNGPQTTLTISLADPDVMARSAEKVVSRAARLKLKLGGGDGLDVERVRAVRSVTDVPIQVDVNEWWTFDEALPAMHALADLDVDYCEQPLAAADEKGQELRELAPIPIYVDEDCRTLADVAACSRIAHGINIKLAKCGGIAEAIRMVHAARALNLGVMLGSMVESGLGIAAAAAMASLCDHVDLDANLLLKRDPWPGVALIAGIQTPSKDPGLGVREAS